MLPPAPSLTLALPCCLPAYPPARRPSARATSARVTWSTASWLRPCSAPSSAWCCPPTRSPRAALLRQCSPVSGWGREWEWGRGGTVQAGSAACPLHMPPLITSPPPTPLAAPCCRLHPRAGGRALPHAAAGGRRRLPLLCGAAQRQRHLALGQRLLAQVGTQPHGALRLLPARTPVVSVIKGLLLQRDCSC